MIEKPQKEVPLLLTISLFLCKKIGVPMLTFDIALFVSCSLSSLSFFSFLEEPWILQTLWEKIWDKNTKVYIDLNKIWKIGERESGTTRKLHGFYCSWDKKLALLLLLFVLRSETKVGNPRWCLVRTHIQHPWLFKPSLSFSRFGCWNDSSDIDLSESSKMHKSQSQKQSKIQKSIISYLLKKSPSFSPFVS